MTQRGLEDPVHHVRDEVLQPVEELGEVDERALGLDVGVLGHVVPGPGLLGPVALRHAEHVAHGQDVGLQVELRGLGEDHLEISPGEQMLPEGIGHHAPHLEHLAGVLAPKHDVPVFKLHVWIGVCVQDGVGPAARGAADQLLVVVGGQLVTTWGGLALGNRGDDPEDGHLGLGGQHDGLVGLAHVTVEHALEVVGAVPHGYRHQSLALSPQPVHPALHQNAQNMLMSSYTTYKLGLTFEFLVTGHPGHFE